MEMTVKLQGFQELAAALRDLPGNLGRNTLRSAVGAGAAEVRKAARENARRMADTGTLARSIYSKQIREQSGPLRQVYFVGARQGKKLQKVGKKGLSQDAYYARWVEFGHFSRTGSGGRRLIRGTDRLQRKNQELADQVMAGSVRWIAAKPFLRPAFESRRSAAIDAIGDKIRQRLETFKVTR